MNILNVTVRTIIKRPFIILVPGLLMLLFSVLNIFNPLFTIVLGLVNISRGTFFESIIALLQLMLNSGWIPMIILFFLIFTVVVSLLAGVIFSGYLYVLDNTLGQREKSEKEYITGVKKYFTKIFLITLRSVFFLIIFIIFILIACVPALAITGAAAAQKPELMIFAIFIDLLTLMVLFFALMFSRSYLFYWYPAAIKNTERPFSEGKKFVDKNFWKIAFSFLVFDIVFVAFLYIILSVNILAIKLILGCIFGTIFFINYIIFIFHTYKKYS